MKTARFVSYLTIFVIILAAFSLPGVALAQDEQKTEEPDTVTLSTEYPKIEAIATGTFDFNVELVYKGTINRVFDLNATAPAGWDVYVTPQYEAQRISSISIDSSYSGVTKNLKVTSSPLTWPLPDPGEYKVTLEVVSDNVVGKIDLIAKVTAKYVLNAAPSNELYNTTATAGRDNTYSIQVTNLGTAVIDNISFSSNKPDGWEIAFQPEKIDLLETVDPKTIDVNIKPAPKTVAGDYMVTLQVSGKQASARDIDVRVTVEAPTIWGWVGVGIIVVVVVGLIFIFMRFGRR